ncbi:unnamed protein product, partial [Ixodes pacificus]
CGGSIIKRDVVLTAAHCLPEGLDTTASNIYAGSMDVSKVGLYLQRRKIKQAIIHEDYWGDVMPDPSHDIGLIKLTRPFDFEASKGRIGTVCLAKMPPRPGKAVTIAGWGLTSPDGPPSDHLLAITVPVIKDKICRNTHSFYYRPKSMFCCGENSKQAGRGDSGGPALVTTAGKSLQVGLTCFLSRGKEYISVVFTKVSTHREWIADTLKKLK